VNRSRKTGERCIPLRCWKAKTAKLGPLIEEAEAAIQERLREVVESFSVFEESELYAALRMLRRFKAQLLTAA
jgi:hypothetical protein